MQTDRTMLHQLDKIILESERELASYADWEARQHPRRDQQVYRGAVDCDDGTGAVPYNP